MEVTARLTSKGQITIPKAVREVLGLVEGDQVVFRVERNRAVISQVPSACLPPSVGVAWQEVRRQARGGVRGAVSPVG